MASSRIPRSIAVLLCLGLGLLASCGGYRLQSAWSADAVSVDGNPDDWGAIPFLQAKAEDVRLAVRNDDHALYVFVSTDRPELVTRMLQGETTLWIDVRGSKGKARSVQVPGDSGEERVAAATSSDREAAPPQQAVRTVVPGTLLEQNGDAIALVANRAGHPDGLAASYLHDQGWLGCEIRVPIGPGSAFPELAPGRAGRQIGIGLGFEGPDPAGGKGREPGAGKHPQGHPGGNAAPGGGNGRGEEGQGRGGRAMGGGRHGGGGMGGGLGGGHSSGGSRAGTPEPFPAVSEVWFSIALAREPSK